MSTISTGTSLTTAFVINGDTTGELVVKTGAGASTALTLSATGTLSLATGNLTFSSTGQRITGDMSNATHSSRLLFQNSGANLPTVVGALPNGSSVTSAFVAYGGSTATDTATVSVVLNGGTDARINSGILGTGSYLPMTFYTGGSERMRLDTSGNLGIGTSTPTAPLTIASVSGTAAAALIQGEVNNERFQIRSAVGSTGLAGGTAVVSIFGSRGTIASPSASLSGDQLGYYQLGGYDGTNWVRSAWITGLAAENYSATNRGSHLTFATTPIGSTAIAERMRIDSSGNVGIGTASPVQRLTVESTSDVRATIRNSTENTSYASSLDFATGSGSLASTNVVARVQGLITQADPSALQSALAFHTNSGDSVSEKMRISAAGNVGIGTSSPSAKLTVNSSGVAPAAFTMDNYYYVDFAANQATSSIGFSMSVRNASGTLLPAGYVTAVGGSSPQMGFIAPGSSNGAVLFGRNNGSGGLLESLRIASNGAVGVGQSNPSAKLDVLSDSGDIVRFINSSVVGVSLSAGSNSFTTLSDERNKTDLVPISDAVGKLKELRTVVGRYNQDAVGVERSFLIAQDVQKAFPPAVDANKPDELGLRYTDMIPLLVAAIKEQQEQIKALQDKIAALEAK